ncbi:MAG: outer membrane protein assembly factor [candidate division Zixibacteria bacterium]|nr:outer membrane protein assembly factor [candidate division Zixibacteria bacterium]
MILVSSKRFVGIAIVGLLLVSSLFASEKQYRKYNSQTEYEEYFTVGYDRETITIKVVEGDTETRHVFSRSDVTIEPESIVLDESVVFERDGLLVNGRTYPYDLISDARILAGDEVTTISFMKRADGSNRSARVRGGNLISFDQTLVVDEEQFVRGLLFSVKGDIEVYGEVNKDIITLFGNTYVGPGAVARGDIATVTGRIDVAGDASVYGELFSGSDRRSSRVHRFRQKSKSASLSATLTYNRVDGALPSCRAGFEDLDSLLPSVWVEGGYAFESKHWRYGLGLEQTLWRDRPLIVGGEFYRRLASEDDWIIEKGENTIFALLVTEDFRDYYEAEGGTAYLHFKPFETVTFDARYRSEETNWLDAQPHLWSLFGGDKLFRSNFSSIGGDLRTQAISEIDTTTNASLGIGLEWNTLDADRPYAHSGWRLNGNIEWAHPDIGSDFDYRRFVVSARRYQEVHRRAMILVRGMFGNACGTLPVYKQFYLGGLGTLRGYDYKELSGNRFWMVNAEYRIDFPRSDLGASILWDIGRITDNSGFEDENEVRNSVGIALMLGDQTRISLSKRLDRSFDNEPRIHGRFDYRF